MTVCLLKPTAKPIDWLMSERRPHKEMAELLNAMATMKQRWIDGVSFGKNKRSDIDIAFAKRDLSVLRQASADYASASKREAAE